MAFREVELSEEERAAMSQKFFKFNAIGDRLAGVFVSSRMASGKFGEQREYLFRTKDGQVALTPPTDAAKKLEKIGLKPGWKVLITYDQDIDVGKEKPMKHFKVLFEESIAPPAAPAPAPAAAPKAPAGAEDIPF